MLVQESSLSNVSPEPPYPGARSPAGLERKTAMGKGMELRVSLATRDTVKHGGLEMVLILE